MRRLFFRYFSSGDPGRPGSKKAKLRTLVSVVFILLFLLPATTHATIYFFTSTGGASVATLGNWNSSSTGAGGTTPGNFTTTGDVFNIRPTAVATLGGNWTIGTAAATADIVVNDSGSLTLSGTSIITLNGNATNSAKFNVAGGGQILFTNTTAGLVNLASNNANCTFIVLAAGKLATVNATGIVGAGCSITKQTNAVVTINAGADLEFNGAAQTMTGFTNTAVNNLTLGGSLAKTLPGTLASITGNLTLLGTASTTTVAAMTVTGNMNIGDGTSVTAAGFAMTISGTTTVGAGGSAGTLTINSATGRKSFYGDIVVNANGVYNNSINTAIYVVGSITSDVAATFTAGSGVISMIGASKTINGVLTIPKLAITGSVTNNGTLTVTTSLTGGGSLVQGSGDQLTINAPATGLTLTTLDASTNPNTTIYAGAAQTIKPVVYSSLSLGGSGIKTIATIASITGNLTLFGTATATTASAFTVTGNLNVGDGTTLTAAGFAMAISGTTTVGSGGTAANLTINSATGQKSFNGDIVVSSTGVLSTSALVPIYAAGNITHLNTTSSIGTGVISMIGASKTISGTIIIPKLAIPGSVTNNGILTVTTSLTGGGSLVQGVGDQLTINAPATGLSLTTLDATTNPNTVIYALSGVQTVKPIAYHALSLGGTSAKTMTGVSTINSNFTLFGSASATAATALTIGGNVILATGTTFAASTFTHNVAGDWTNNNTTFTSSGTINFNGTVQSINGTTGTTFNNITTAGTTAVTTGANISTSGTLTIADGTSVTSAGFTMSISGTTTVGGGTSGSLIMNSTAGRNSFNGDVVVSANGVWNNSGNAAIYVAGSITSNVSATFTAGSGVLTMNGATKTINGDLTIPKLAIVGTVTNNGTLTVTTSLTGSTAGTLSQGSGSELNLVGVSNSVLTVNASVNPNTVNYTGAAQTVRGGTYHNLVLMGSGAKTFDATATTVNSNLTLLETAAATTGANLSVVGNLNIGDGTSITAAGFAMTISGTTTVGAGGSAGTLTINSATGRKSFYGDLVVNANGVYNNSANAAIYVVGSITSDVAATFTAGSGVISMIGATKTINGIITIPKLAITGSVTNNGTLTVTTSLTGSTAGILTQGSGSSLNLGGASNASLAIDAEGNPNTVNYTGAAQTIRGGDYYNLVLMGSGAKTFDATVTTVVGNLTLLQTAAATTGADLSVTGNLDIGDGTSITAAGFAMTISGTTTIGDGGSAGTLTINSATGRKSFYGDIVVSANGVYNNSANAAIYVVGSITSDIAATFTAGSGVISMIGASKTINGPITIPKLAITDLVTNNGTLTVTTSLTGGGSLVQGVGDQLTINAPATGLSLTTLDASTNPNTVIYALSGAQTVKPIAYHALSLGGTSAKTMTGVSTINSNFTLFGSASATAATALTIGGDVILGSGTTFAASTFTHNVAGDWTNDNTTFTSSGTINFNGTIQSINGTTGTTFNNIATTGTTAVTTGASISATGTLTIGDGTSITAAGFAMAITGTTTVGAGTSGSLIINNTTGRKSFNGDIVVSAGGVYNNTANAAIYAAGSITSDVAATFTAGSGVLTMLGLTKTINGAVTIPNLAIVGTVTNNGTLTVTTAFSGPGTLTQGTGDVLNLGGITNSVGTLVASANPNTVNYTGAAQAVRGGTYHNLVLMGSGAKTFDATQTIINGNLTLVQTAAATTGANMTVTGNLNIGDGTSLTAAAFALAISGTTTVGDGGSAGTLTISSATGSKSFNGDIVVNANGVWNNSANAVILVAGSITSNVAATFTAGSGVLTMNGAAKTINGNITIPKLAIPGSVTNNGTLTVTTSLTGGGSLIQGAGNALSLNGENVITTLDASATNNTVSYISAVAQIVRQGPYYNLSFSGAGTKTTAAGNYIIGGYFNTAGGTAALNTNNTSFTVTGNVLGAGNITMGSGVLALAGNWTNSGSFTAGTGSVNYNNAAGGQLIGGVTYNVLTFGNTSGTQTANAGITTATLNTTAGGTLDMVTFPLAVSSTVNHAGILNTQNTSGTPLPVNKTWAGNVFYNSSSSQTIVSGNYGNLNGTGGNRILSTTGIVGIAGTLTPGGGSYTSTSSTVEFNGTGAQTVPVLTYHNLFISGNKNANAVTLSPGTIAVAGSFSTSGASNLSYTTTGNTMDFNGTAAQNIGAFNFNDLTISGNKNNSTITLASGTIGVAGAFSVTATNVLNYAIAGNTFDFNGTGAQSIGAFNFNNLTISGNKNNNDITLANGVIGVAGAFSVTATNVNNYLRAGNTFDFNGTGAQTIGAFTYNNLTVSGNKNSNTITLGAGTIGVSGNFTTSGASGVSAYITTGNTFDFNGTGAQSIGAFNFNNLTISGNKNSNSITLASGVIGVAGAFTTSGASGISSYITTGNTVNFNGAGAQTIDAFNFNNLTISGNKGGATITLANGGTIGVAGAFTTSGASNLSYSVTNNTFDYNGSGAQTITAPFTYHNLVISNANTKTIVNGTIVTCFTLTINGSAVIDVPSTANSLVITQ